MKYLAVLTIFCCLASLNANENPLNLSDSELKALGELDPSHLPEDLRLKLKAGDNTHWCCSNEQPVNSVDRTRVEAVTKTVATKVKVGYTDCGFAGWMSCSLYAIRYRQETEYVIQTYQVLNFDSCKDHHVVCCKGYTLIANNCMENSQLIEHAALLIQLQQAGLLGK